MSFGPRNGPSPQQVRHQKRLLAEAVAQETEQLRRYAAQQRQQEEAAARRRRQPLRARHHQVMHDNRLQEATVGCILYDGYYGTEAPLKSDTASPALAPSPLGLRAVRSGTPGSGRHPRSASPPPPPSAASPQRWPPAFDAVVPPAVSQRSALSGSLRSSPIQRKTTSFADDFKSDSDSDSSYGPPHATSSLISPQVSLGEPLRAPAPRSRIAPPPPPPPPPPLPPPCSQPSFTGSDLGVPARQPRGTRASGHLPEAEYYSYSTSQEVRCCDCAQQ
eukprot:EG_transcript_20099